MKTELNALVEMSHRYGRDKEHILAAGGNTSYKNDSSVWVKGSGRELGLVSVEDFVECDRKALEANLDKTYSSDPESSFREARRDMLMTMKDPFGEVQPSVETSIHVLLQAPYVAHTHPTIVNALTSSRNGQEKLTELFADSCIFVDYKYPGFALFQGVKKQVTMFRYLHEKDPDYIFLKNHGIVVGGSSPGEIEEKFTYLFNTISVHARFFPDVIENEVDAEKLSTVLPAVRMMLSEDEPRVLKFKADTLVGHFVNSKKAFEKVHRPFCYDHVKHGEGRYLFIDNEIDSPGFMANVKSEIKLFKTKNGYLPKVVMIKGLGLITADCSNRDAGILMDIFTDQMKISYLAGSFGGPVFLEDTEIELIRERLGCGAGKEEDVSGKEALVGNRIAIVTGGAQGFGEGIVRDLFANRANVVIADLNPETSNRLLSDLNSEEKPNRAIFVKTDVSDPGSVKNLIEKTVLEFGGLDLMVSNAGVLFAGGLDEMDPDKFDLVTQVNYKGYFLCAKYSSAVMKLQSEYHEKHWSDIIQINSKSGLKGSNKNFAYAGGKFGGIGLTQSFAMELMPYRIKVNSIAPGNLFDGPLWSDPENGLFVQYLRAGKVPGAKTIEDVKRSYEAQVPANRGCTEADVMKAVYYIIDQKYETGQAVPVTGGQIMLN